MPRRRALRLMGATAVMAAIPALRPGRARGHVCASPDVQVHCSDGRFGTHYCCSVGQKCCKGACIGPENQCCQDPRSGLGFGCPPAQRQTSDGRTVRTKCGDPNSPGGSCPQSITCPLGTTCCGPGSGAYECGNCCQKNEECAGKRCVAKCPSGRERCRSKCCAKGEECVNGRCTKKCPPRRVRCGKDCCPEGQRCVDPRTGKCSKCRRNQQACGDECCPRDQYCCGTNKQGGLCCPRRGGECCSNTDAKGNATYLCCTKPTRCAYPISLNPDGSTGGIDRGKPKSCCPEERYVAQHRSCCPPNHVSLGGRLVVPPGGGGGLCCRKDKLCGDPASPTCCSSGSASYPEQVCCGGTCTHTTVDPNNCGRCGNVCPPDTFCQSGNCIAT